MKVLELTAASRCHFPGISGRLPRRAAFLLLSTVTALLSAPQRGQGAPFTFENTGSLATARYAHTTTLLQNGKMLVAGGYGSSYLASAELYDSASGTWTATGSLATTRRLHTATLLSNGKVLVVGGSDGSYLASAELYDPTNGTWAVTGSLATARGQHTATLLPNGKVLVAGGYNGSYLASAELYDPASETWTSTGSLAAARYGHTATLLPNGKILVLGGYNGTSFLASAELYDPTNGSWRATGSLGTARHFATTTLLPTGKVLAAAGYNGSYLANAEVYDPASGIWSATGDLATARNLATASLLPNGKVLVAGGYDGSYLATAELYDPMSGTWSATGSLTTGRTSHTATLLPNGNLLLAGGNGSTGSLSSAEIYDPTRGMWSGTGSLAATRYGHTATMLSSGRVLVAGGFDGSEYLASAELYDPTNETWMVTGSLPGARHLPTATLLPNGKVLVAGGYNGSYPESSLLYDSTSGKWTATGGLATGRKLHTATLLPNGKVLITGGVNSSGNLASAELYDPASGTWSATGNLTSTRYGHTATLLPNGQVLLAGGDGGISYLASSELYDPARGTWTATGSLASGRNSHTATLLPNGKVLIAGGYNGRSYLTSAELYDPASGVWSVTGTLVTGRNSHTGTLLQNGEVLIAGGYDGSGILTSTELYDPASGSWIATSNFTTGRNSHTATLLPNGKVLAAGGANGSGILASGELYDAGLRFSSSWQPEIFAATSRLVPGSRLVLSGSRFQGVSQASGGTSQNSSTNYPVVQLRRLDSIQVAFLPVDPTAGWSDTAFTSIPLSGFPFGPAQVTVFTNGIPSAAKYLVVAPPNNAPVANDQSVVTSEDAFTRAVILTASDADADILSYAVVTSPIHGVLSGTAPRLTYTPAANYNGPDSFTFKANDGQVDSNVVTFSITVNAVNDAPSFTKGPDQASAPDAGPETVSNWATNISPGPPDESGQSITFIVANSDHGLFSSQPAISSTGTLTYTPAAGGSGTATVSVILQDNGGTADGGRDTSATQSFTITVGAQPTATPTASPSVNSTTLGNISTRLRVQNGDNVLIGGMIATGTSGKKVIIRAIGPTLTDFGLPGALADPTLELLQGNVLIASNDDWRASSQQADIQRSGFAPNKDAESAIIATLTPNQNYTAIVRGKNGEPGIGLVEAFDLDQAASSKLGNISTRGFVDLDDDVMIAGLIVGPPGGPSTNVLVRALGPTLGDFGVQGFLANPTLDLVNSNGTVLRSNDSWKSSQAVQIQAANLAPKYDQEAALVATLAPGAYTAIVRGSGRTTGVGLVEVYNISP